VRIPTRSFKAFACVVLIALAIVATTVSASEAGGGFHRSHGFYGPRVFIGGPLVVAPYPWWYYPRPAYYYPPPVIVQEPPPVYVQQPPAPAPAAESYWYYCASAQGYYPTVESCPEAWIKVPPRP